MSLENGEINAYSQGFSFIRGINDGCINKSIRFVLFIAGFTIAVISCLDSYYTFDLHSRNEQGSMASQGKSLLLNVSGLQDIEKYIQVVHLQRRNQNHAYFQIQYVQINIRDENISHKHLPKSLGVARKQRH